jgi:putative phosphoesterase
MNHTVGRRSRHAGKSLVSLTVRVVVIADTHLSDNVAARLSPLLLDAIKSADVLLHAGDVTTQSAFDELSALATVHCVLGNNDISLVGLVPAQLELTLEGVEVAMIHDSGSRTGRAARLAVRFPDADLVVYGHSHVPDDSEGLGGQRLFNPGSPTQRRAQPLRTYGLLELQDGRILSHEIRSLGR